MKKISKLIILILIISIVSLKVLAQETNIQLRILTFNIYHGATMNNDFDLNKIAQVINSVNPDLVALQEVDYKTNQAKKMDLSTELAKLTNLTPLFGRAMYYDNGEYGIAVSSKYTFIKTQRHLLPYSDKLEPRIALEVLFEFTTGDTIRFVNTHLDYTKNSKDRVNQIKNIIQLFKNNDYPTILAGDFNAVPESDEIKSLLKTWTSCSAGKNNLTFPSDNPEKTIDYIFFKPQISWEIINYKVICDKIASDHCAVFSVLSFIAN
ncbi:MAG: endonuclease/exonuclease/phosphatase family protein [Bacteroidales bacterium]|nr:endonuclease/exonuclease/phosphatase family protein [Bacteroidales bacterium]